MTTRPAWRVHCWCGCGPFETTSKLTRYRTPGCRSRVKRAAEAGTPISKPTEPPIRLDGSDEARAAINGTATGAPTSGREPVDRLVEATEKELGDKAETLDGQIAIHLARQVKAATGSAAATLAKELRTVVDRALRSGQPPAAAGPPSEDQPEPAEPAPEPPDDLELARRAREAKAAAAAEVGQ